MGDDAREARSQALARLYNEGARTSITATGTSQGNSSQQQQPSNSRLATAAAASSAAVYPPASNPPELADTQQWSKTKLVEAVPGWARGHAREVKHLAAWADSLFDDSTRATNLQRPPPPPLGGGPYGAALRGVYSELLAREESKGHQQGLPQRLWQATYESIEPLLRTLRQAKQQQQQSQQQHQQHQSGATSMVAAGVIAVAGPQLAALLRVAVAEYVARVRRAVAPPPASSSSHGTGGPDSRAVGEAAKEKPSDASSSRARTEVLHCYFVALGDLHRYLASLPPQPDERTDTFAGDGAPPEDGRASALWAAARYYWQALALAPSGGKVWNQLAVCGLAEVSLSQEMEWAAASTEANRNKHNTARFASAAPAAGKPSADTARAEAALRCTAAYRYLRALTSVKPFPARENYLSCAAALRAYCLSLPRVNALSLMSGAAHGERARLHLHDTVAALVTRVEIGRVVAAPSAAAASAQGPWSSSSNGGGNDGDDATSLFRRHLRLWLRAEGYAPKSSATSGLHSGSNSGTAGGDSSSEQVDFRAESSSVRVSLVEAALTSLSAAHAIGSDASRRARTSASATAAASTWSSSSTLVSFGSDEAWKGACALVEGLLEDLLSFAVPEVGLGATWLLARWALTLDSKASITPSAVAGSGGRAPSSTTAAPRSASTSGARAENGRTKTSGQSSSSSSSGQKFATADERIDRASARAASAAAGKHAAKRLRSLMADYLNKLLTASPELDAFLVHLVDTASSAEDAAAAGDDADGSAWEVQETAGFAGWPEAEGSNGTAAGDTATPSSSLATAWLEPTVQDWQPLARRLVRLAYAATITNNQTLDQSDQPPLLSLRRTQRERWRFDAPLPQPRVSNDEYMVSGQNTDEAAAAALLPSFFQVDDVLGLLGDGAGAQKTSSGAEMGGAKTGNMVEEDDDDGEEFLLQPPGLGGGGGAGDNNKSSTAYGDAAGLPSFFAKGGHLPDGVDTLFGDIGGLEEDHNDGDHSNEDEARLGSDLMERLEKATLEEEEEANSKQVFPPPGLPTRGGMLHGVQLPKPPLKPNSTGGRNYHGDVYGSGSNGHGNGGKGRGGKGSHGGAAGRNSKGYNSNSYGSTSGSRNSGSGGGGFRPLIVLDCPNIAMRHGQQRAMAQGSEHASQFSSRGIALAADFFRFAGHRVVGFLPDFLLDLDKVAERKRVARLGGGFASDAKARQLPDDVQLLRSLQGAGIIVGTPPQDYDDAYSIRYAQQHGGCVVTNDMFRDHVASFDKPGGRIERDAQRAWTKTHLISYTFVGDDFLPNPTFSFENAT